MRKRHGLEKHLEGDRLDFISSRWALLKQEGKYDPQLADRCLALRQSYIERLNPKSMRDIIRNKEKLILLDTAIHYLGEKYVKGHVMLLINAVFMKIKAGKVIEGQEVYDVASMIIDDFGHLFTFSDIKMCLTNGIKGLYGEIYDRLDAEILYKWFDRYKRQRIVTSVDMKRDHEEEFKKGVPMPAEVKEKFDQLEKRLANHNREIMVKYESLEDYCKQEKKNYQALIKKAIEPKWTKKLQQEYSRLHLKYEDFIRVESRKLLFKLNHPT